MGVAGAGRGAQRETPQGVVSSRYGPRPATRGENSPQSLCALRARETTLAGKERLVAIRKAYPGLYVRGGTLVDPRSPTVSRTVPEHPASIVSAPGEERAQPAGLVGAFGQPVRILTMLGAGKPGSDLRGGGGGSSTIAPASLSRLPASSRRTIPASLSRSIALRTVLTLPTPAAIASGLTPTLTLTSAGITVPASRASFMSAAYEAIPARRKSVLSAGTVVSCGAQGLRSPTLQPRVLFRRDSAGSEVRE
jgi:hypothetical protein